MYYDRIDDLEVAIDRKDWKNYLKRLGDRVVASVPLEELLAEYLETDSENIDYVDWDYSKEQFRVCLNDEIEESIATKNQWRDYREPEEESDIDLEDTF